MMDFKLNDQISVIDQNLSGTVIKIKKNSIIFRDGHGFDYEFDKRQIVKKGKIDYDSGENYEKTERSTKKSQKNRKGNAHRLDLHFEKLVSSSKNYSAVERLEKQRDTLISTIDFCRQNHIKKLEIIHGIGDGVLQQMVQNYLSDKGFEFYDNAVLQQQSGSITVFF